MTTPERLRRRQRIEAFFLILVGVLMLGQTWYFNTQDSSQRECISDKFRELSIALDVRSESNEKETRAEKEIWLTYAEAAGALKNKPPQTELPEEQQNRLNKQLIDALLNYQSVVDEIQKDRKKNPLPPYPIGVCQ